MVLDLSGVCLRRAAAPQCLSWAHPLSLMVLDLSRVCLPKECVQTFFGGRALEGFSKTRILLVGFGYHGTNFRKLAEINGALMGGKRPFPGQRSSIGP